MNNRYGSTSLKMALSQGGIPQHSYGIRRGKDRIPEKSLAGFSIIELIMVVFIIGIMSAGGIAAFRGFRQKTSVRVAARDVTSIMRLARRKAIVERRNYLAVYDLGSEKVWVQSYSSYNNDGLSPDSGTVQSLPDTAVIARVTYIDDGIVGEGPTGTGIPGEDTNDEGSYSIGYHKFTPKSTVTSGSVWLKDEELEHFYKVTLLAQTARARIYSEW